MQLLPDRISLETDERWHVELQPSNGKWLNDWSLAQGPAYRVEGSRLLFTAGPVVDLGSRVIETFSEGRLVIARTERGPADSPAENVVAVDHDGRIAWRIPRHGFANSLRPIPYENAFPFNGKVRVTGQPGHLLDLDPITGAIIHAEVNYR
jgi:hypothetical protein